MKKQMLIMMTAILLLISINIINVNSMMEYWQTKESSENGTVVQNHLVTFYKKASQTVSATPRNTFLCTYFYVYCYEDTGIIKDYITGNNPFEVYIWYNIYVNKWNQNNPNDKVDYCELKIQAMLHNQNVSTIIFDKNYTEADQDIMNGKYFVLLYDGDGFMADQICYFENASTSLLDLPAEMQLVTPTWECKACGYYEWTVVERNVEKAKAVGNNVAIVMSYIQKLGLINFEIWLALFWIFLILCIFISISFIFWGIYFVFLYLRRLAK
jgi:hypothetical protein